MQKIATRVFIILFLSLSGITFAQITEGFEAGLPSSAPSTETQVTLGSGVWTIYKAVSNTDKYAGTYCCSISSTGYIISPAFSGVTSISFYAKVSGSSTIKVQKSVNGGEFTDVGTQSISSGAYFPCNFTPADSSENVRIRIINSTGTSSHRIDNISIVSPGSMPAIKLSAVTMPSFGVAVAGTNTTSASYTVTGLRLLSNLLITAPTGFQVSTDNTSFSSSVTLSPVSGSVSATTIYVRFSPSEAKGTVAGIISHTSTNADIKEVSVSGVAIASEPSVQSAISFGNVTGSSVTVNFSGGNGTHRVLLAKLNAAPEFIPNDGSTISGVSSDYSNAPFLDDGSKPVFAGTASSVTVTGLAVASTYYFTVFEYNGDAKNSENYLITNANTSSQATLAVAGLTVTPSSLAFGNVVKMMTSSEKAYQISGKYLTPAAGNITVTAPAGFQVSSTSGAGYSSFVTIPYTNSALEAANLFVRFTPTAVVAYSGAITNSGGGAPDISVAVSGTGADSTLLYIKTYYVSPSGSDGNTGTIDAPFFNLSTAIAQAKAGDTIYMRGGTYAYSATIRLTTAGTAKYRIHILNYPDEHPVLDFSAMVLDASNRGFLLTGDYWFIKGLEIYRAGDNGIKVEGSHNRIERCVFHHNQDSGLQIGFAHETNNPDGLMGSYNEVINCDSYNNFDKNTLGGNADGFACKMHNGKGNVFRGCRSWENSDDGWDLYETDWPVIMDSCWTWHNGDKSLFETMSSFSGNGNGFKLGGNGTGGSSEGTHVVSNSVSFNNNYASKKGFDQNSHKGGVDVYNCTSFGNGYNFMFEDQPSSGCTNRFRNCVSYNALGGLEYEFATGTVSITNSWDLNIVAASTDFLDLTEATAKAPRGADGSLPKNNFAKLSPKSKLIDVGTIIGLPYAGSAPDLGAFEYGLVADVKNEDVKLKGFALAQNYPNPFNPATTLRYSLPQNAKVSLSIYDITGREILVLVNEEKAAGTYSVKFSAGNLASGIYFAKLHAGTENNVIKMTLLK